MGRTAGWAPDEIYPPAILDGVRQRFSAGWHGGIYPPLHHYLLALVFAPVFVGVTLDWVSLYSGATQMVLIVLGRLLSVAMGLATLLGVALLAARTIDRRHAWPAALCAGVFLPFPFYAKTINVDVPYVCWFVWSMVFLCELYRSARVRNAAALGITAAAAVATKDQAYGLYILPAAMLLWRYGRSRQGWLVLATGALVAAATLAVCYNVVFNRAGMFEHFAFIVGPASSGYGWLRLVCTASGCSFKPQWDRLWPASASPGCYS